MRWLISPGEGDDGGREDPRGGVSCPLSGGVITEVAIACRDESIIDGA